MRSIQTIPRIQYISCITTTQKCELSEIRHLNWFEKYPSIRLERDGRRENKTNECVMLTNWLRYYSAIWSDKRRSFNIMHILYSFSIELSIELEPNDIFHRQSFSTRKCFNLACCFDSFKLLSMWPTTATTCLIRSVKWNDSIDTSQHRDHTSHFLLQFKDHNKNKQKPHTYVHIQHIILGK